MIAADPSVEVVYINFHEYGLAPLERFLASYAHRLAGHPHILTVALKGHVEGPERDAVVDRCRASGASVIDVPNGGFDIGTYYHAARISRADILCLMNTNSEILGDAWLAKLVGALVEQGGGAVSATGSWQSIASDQWNARMTRPVSQLRRAARMGRLLYHFPIFPNRHLRTNALVIARHDLLCVKEIDIQNKEQAWRFESGRAGLSATLRRKGLALRIVGRDGRVFAPATWHRSGIFWQGEQENLLVSDNQTQSFANGDAATRAALHNYAWIDPRRARKSMVAGARS